MNSQDILSLDATDQARLIRDGKVSSRELVQLSITRIEQDNPGLNTVIHQRFETALAESDNPVAGPFSGVPFLLKDLDVFLQGQPAISLPLAQSQEGLPIGVQLVAGAAREDHLFQAAADLERVQTWKSLLE